ncbi:MAG: hypothetical protein Q8O40_09915 [Chloroflexota bacterium]|nr:hypothetical protein [Chloroflexota bacterium]
MLDRIGLVLGITFIFTAPGYAWSVIVLGERAQRVWERMAVAVGLSLGLAPLTVFWLSWLVGMPVNLLDTFLVALALSIAPLGYLWLKRRGVPAWLRATPPGTSS